MLSLSGPPTFIEIPVCQCIAACIHIYITLLNSAWSHSFMAHRAVSLEQSMTESILLACRLRNMDLPPQPAHQFDFLLSSFPHPFPIPPLTKHWFFRPSTDHGSKPPHLLIHQRSARIRCWSLLRCQDYHFVVKRGGRPGTRFYKCQRHRVSEYIF
jgi:hypothetical protein